MLNTLFKYIAVVLLLQYFAMQLLCIMPVDNRSQVVFLLWFICSCLAYPSQIRKVLRMKMLIPLYLFLIYYGLTMIVNHSVVYSISSIISMCELFSPFLMFRLLRGETRFIRWMVFFVITVILITNYITCSTYISLTGRGLRALYELNEIKNVFFVVYSFAILVPSLVYIIHGNYVNSSTRWSIKMILGYIISALLAYFVIKAQFMTAIVLLVLGVILAYFYNRRGSIIVISLAMIFTYGLFLNYSDELIHLADKNNAIETSMRIEELQHILSNNVSRAEDFSERQNLTQTSFQAFWNNPILGVAYKYKDFEESKLYIGNHAEWIDTMARYGLFGLLLLYFLFRVIKQQRLYVGKNISYILFGVLVFLNPVSHFYFFCTVFLYIPLSCNLLSKEQRFKSYGKM